ncbi:MAG: SIMPL domain-containing protein, partial [Methanocella sp.]
MHDKLTKHLPLIAILTLGVGLAALTGLTLAVSETLGKALRPAEAVIAVAGEATAKADPDRAEFTLGLESRGATAREAQTKNAGTMEKVVAALVGAGIDRKDIRTSAYNLTPVRRWDQKSGREITEGYQVTSLVTATTGETARVGALVDTAVNAGANTVQGVAFSVADQGKVRQQALAQAVADARNRAQQMASAAGVRVGKITAMTDATVEAPVVYASKDRLLDTVATAQTPVEPGQVRVTAR